MKRIPKLLIIFVAALPLSAAEPPTLPQALTYSNRPLGSPSQPLILRTFMPDIGLPAEVFTHHHHSANSPKYNLTKGKDVPGEYKPIAGLTAAIGVNYGSELSFCWDTVECRLLYAWNNGFLDMQNYWGNPDRGNRQSFNYVPQLVGTLFYQAAGKHPLIIDGKSLSDLETPPTFQGFHHKGKKITFNFKAREQDLHCEVSKGDSPQSLVIRYRLQGTGELSYQKPIPNHELERISQTEIVITIQGQEIAQYQGSQKQNLLKGGVNAESGKRVFAAMACATCHSLDGSKGHGPSLLGLHGKPRNIQGQDEPVTADDNYILESIKQPNAKVVAGFPENYMPPYQLEKDQAQALLLYLKTLKN